MRGWIVRGGLIVASLCASGCVTGRLLKLGDPDPAPHHYDASYIAGKTLVLQYSAVIDGDEVKQLSSGAEEHVALDEGSWRPVRGPVMDPNCTPQAWAMRPTTPTVPTMVLNRPGTERAGADVHDQVGAGVPPISLQLQGTDFWMYCGTGDGVAMLNRVHAPAESGKPASAIVGIVLLFPFALTADLLFGAVAYGLGAR